MKTQLKYSASNFIKLLENLILNIGLARAIINLTSFGKLQQFFIIVTFLVTISSAFPTSLNYFIGKHISVKSKNALYKRFFFSMLLLGILSGIIIYTLKFKFFDWFDNDFFISYIYYFIPILILKVINSFFSNYYLFSNKLDFLNVSSFSFVLLYLAGFVYFIINQEPIKIVLVFLILYELVKFIVLFIPLIRSVNGFIEKENFLLNKEEFNFVLPTILLVLAGILNMQIDKYMISAMESPEVFALYQVGAFNIPFIAVITTSFFTILTPQVTKYLREGNIKETLNLTALTVKQTSLLLLPIVVFCFFFSGEIIILLFGDKFHESGDIFKIYTLRFLISVFPFSIYMGVIGLKNLASIHVVISALVNVVFNLILIPKFGVMGAVIATLIASYTTVLIPIYFINRRLSTNLTSYFPVMYLLKVIVLSVIIVFPIYYLFKDLLIGNLLYFIIPISIGYYLMTLFVIEKRMLLIIINKMR